MRIPNVTECEHSLRLRKQYATVRFRYIRTELDLAITLCEIAADTQDVSAKSRMLAHARNSYEAAERAKQHSEFTDVMRAEIEQRELRLNSVLLIVYSPLN